MGIQGILAIVSSVAWVGVIGAVVYLVTSIARGQNLASRSQPDRRRHRSGGYSEHGGSGHHFRRGSGTRCCDHGGRRGWHPS